MGVFVRYCFPLGNISLISNDGADYFFKEILAPTKVKAGAVFLLDRRVIYYQKSLKKTPSSIEDGVKCS